MKQHTILRLAIIAVILLQQSGCAIQRGNQDRPKAPAISKELVKTSHSWDGALLPEYPEGQSEITILRITIPAGTRLDMHSHPVINAGVLISGQLRVYTADGKTLLLQAGDPIVEVVNTLHYGVNEGKDPADIIVFYVGIVDKPVTIIENQ